MKDDEYHPEEHEENLYSEEGRSEFVDGGEISSEEEAFMQGYDDAEDDEKESDSEDDDEDEKKEE